ncbi:MAG TPA: phage tail protein I [Metalysinibacillus sp.]
MIDSKNQHLLDVVPQNLVRGEIAYDVIKAIGNQENKLFSKVDKSIIDEDLERQSDDVIWHLLWENHLVKKEEGLELAFDKKARIDLILAAIELHRYKGTPYALDLIFDSLGLDGHITEWFEYDANPYTFKANINVIDIGINEEIYDMFERLINHYKNVRSSFDQINVSLVSNATIYTGATAQMGEILTIYPEMPTEVTTQLAVPVDTGTHYIEKIEIA